MSCNGMLQEFEMLCQSTISLITQRGREGRSEERMMEGRMGWIKGEGTANLRIYLL